MGRRYVRDARGRFASSGYSGQTGGRGARLKAKTERAGGGAKIKASAPAGTVGKPRGLKPNSIKPKPAAQAKPAAPPSSKPARSRRRRPTAEESRARGLTPISEIQARTAAKFKKLEPEIRALHARAQRELHSGYTKTRAQETYAAKGRKRAPYGRFSTIKNPAPEGSFPQLAVGRTWQGRQNAINGAKTAKPKPAVARRNKTELQVLQQADRIMGKLSRRAAAAVQGVNTIGLEASTKKVQRINRRAGRVNASLNSRGLYDKYTKLTARADKTHMTAAGPGIPKPSLKPVAKTGKSKTKSRPKISDAKAERIVSRVDAHRPGLNKASGSLRRTQNSIRTHQRAGDFLLASSRRARKRGGNISVLESVRRAVANAKPAKAKVSRPR